MMTSPLLSNVRHRAMITPVTYLLTKAVKPVLKNLRIRLQLGASKLLAPVSTSRSFGSGTIWSKKSEKTFYCWYSSLASQTLCGSKRQIQDPAP